MIRGLGAREKNAVLDYFAERFGIEKKTVKEFGMYSGSDNKIYLGPKNTADMKSIVSAGILIARIQGNVKPSTNFLQMFGRHARKNFVLLAKENAIVYARGEDVELSEKDIINAAEGHVLVKYLDFSLGCGLLKGNRIKNMLPKAKRLDVKFI